ncbi:uncharacterized protein LOC125047492 [Penaeus chinensis]|uniref:uncharacterized protein LOC125047492 n=1 Tax=Penaeus chinensis TaxID=139456 RepID=UPI001FB85976|nr:uncharacterized protein LOC125047492 [Penaeus chinensis]XP_047501689.1 uncharacterized protein LOC125047492 [Penaeus chinensis]
MMTAFLRRLAVVRGVLLLASPAAIWAQTKSLFPAEEPTPREPLPSCNVAVLGDCLMPGPRPLSWEAAHRHCRSEGGFLLEREELDHFDHLWTSRYQTPLQKNLTMPVSVLSWPALNSTWPGGEATLEDLTWTALTFHGGHYQWLSRFPGFDFYVKWEEHPSPTARDCAAFNLTSNRFRLLPCDRELRFFCILRRPSESPDTVPEDEVELRVTASVKSNHDWVEVSHENQFDLSLTCTAHDARTGAPLAKDLTVFWSKDDVYVNRHYKMIFPAQIHDPTKSVGSPWDSTGNTTGTYLCETWLPRSTTRLVSNKVLVTMKSWTVLILSVYLQEKNPVNLQSATSNIRAALRSQLPDINNYIVDPIFVEESGPQASSTRLVKYRFQVHFPTNLLESVARLFKDDSLYFKYLLRKGGFQRNSTAALATYCLKETRPTEWNGQVIWPFTKAGNTRPSSMRCEVGDKLLPGICRWNYTHGGSLEFDASDCDRFDACPRGYYRIFNDLCVSFTSLGDWESGLAEAYKTGHERSILDSWSFHNSGNQEETTVYNLMKEVMREYVGHSVLWLPVRRLVPRGPLAFVGPGSSYFPYTVYRGSPLFNISWAKDHPDNRHNCLALDVETNSLYTLSCDTKNPFVSIVNISGLQQIPQNNWQDRVPELITGSSACPMGWVTTTWKGDALVCFKGYINKGNYTWSEAESFCENIGAELPSPGVGFLDWAFRQFLHNYGVGAVWMTTERPLWLSNDNDLAMDVVNWLPNTNYSLSHPVLTPHGWDREGEGKTKSTVLCQKKGLERTSREIQLYKRGEGDICIDNEEKVSGSTLLRCFANGREIKEKKSGKPGCKYSIPITVQGYYQCQQWVTMPSQLVKSNILLHRKKKSLTFAVRMSEKRPYIPAIHDNTFRNITQQEEGFDICSAEFVKKFEEVYVSNGLATMKTFIDNYSNLPGKQNRGIMYNFHLNLQFSGKEENERKVFQLFDLLASSSELSSGCVVQSVRSTTKCFSENTIDNGIEERNLTWPNTAGGVIALPKELCITEEGEPVTRECFGSFLTGYYWGPPSSSCMGEPTNKTKQLWKINNNATVEKADIPTTLSSITQNGSTLQPVDIHFVATSFKALSEETEKLDELDLEEIVQTMNNVMEAKDETFVPVQKKLLSSSILYEAFEEMTFKVQLPEAKGDQKVNASRKLITVERFDLEVNSTIIGFESRNGGAVETTIEKGVRTDHADTDVAIILPDNLTYKLAMSHVSMRAKIRTESKIQLAFAVFKNAKLFQDRDSFPNYTVSSPIIQATYRGEVVKNLEQPVTLIFKPPKYGRKNTKCVFWDFSKNGGRGGWSTQGCWKGKSRGNHDVCHCNHLTCFAQLMNYDSDDFDGNHALALDIITIIGCCLSIGGLLLVFTTFFLFKKWRRPLDNKILVNLSFSVFCSIVIFLAGINQTWNKILCRSIAVALHYFILASFGWMLVEAVHQYLKFVKVVGTYIPRFMWKASVSAWGVPVVPIIVVLVCDSSLYDNGDDLHPESKICWMSRDGFLYAFLPPLVLTMIINIIMFSLILYGAVCGRARVNSTMSERSLFISQLRMAICVFVLLGFTWIFGILAIWKGRLLFSYLFCIFNTLQGFFIFIFHVYRGRSARRLWGDFLSVISKSPSSTEPSNSNNAHVSMQYRGHLDSVTYNHGGGILVIPQKPTVQMSTRGMSIKSMGTTSSLLHSRTSYTP